MDSRLAEQAAEAIKELQAKVAALEARLDLHKAAEAIVFKLYDDGSLGTDEIQDVLTTFQDKSREDLEIIEKAAELSRNAGKVLTVGTLSERSQDDGTLDPLTRMLIEDL